jgi:hypothetical protein
MTTDELVRQGKLKRVDVQPISSRERALGDAKKRTQDNQRMAGGQCEPNVRALTAAMLEAGENDWHAVFGIARGTDPRGPVAHAWVRKGDDHFDPTWSLMGPIDECRYFVLVGVEAAAVKSLNDVENIVGPWKLLRE